MDGPEHAGLAGQPVAGPGARGAQDRGLHARRRAQVVGPFDDLDAAGPTGALAAAIVIELDASAAGREQHRRAGGHVDGRAVPLEDDARRAVSGRATRLAGRIGQAPTELAQSAPEDGGGRVVGRRRHPGVLTRWQQGQRPARGALAGRSLNQYAAPMDGLHDQALAEQLRSGDDGAFAQVVQLYSGKVYAIGLSMLRNEQDARDVVQETFLNVHRRIDSFRGEAPLGSWIGRIATNNCLMRLRTRRRKPEVSVEVVGPRYADDGHHAMEIEDWRPLADEQRVTQELGEQIRAAVDDLPASYREVMLLADYQHLSMAEIAAELDLTVPNVKTRLHRARLAVREALAAYLAGVR